MKRKGKLGTSSTIINTNGGRWKTKKARWCCICRKRIEPGSYIKRVRGCFAHYYPCKDRVKKANRPDTREIPNSLKGLV